MENKIQDKVVVITGASSGIGEAIALALAEKGAKIVIGARRDIRLKNLATQIKKFNGECEYAITDVTKQEPLRILWGWP